MRIEEIIWRDPVSCYLGWQGEAGVHLLHSGTNSKVEEGQGWSYLVAAPVSTLSLVGDKCYRDGENIVGNVFDILKSCLLDRQKDNHWDWSVEDLSRPGFTSGAVGYVAYEAAQFCRPPLPTSAPDSTIPLMQFDFYDGGVLFHHHSKRCFLVARNNMTMEMLRDRFDNVPPARFPVPSALLEPLMSSQDYQQRVRAIIRHIYEGDIFQANMTMGFRAEWPNSKLADVTAHLLAAGSFFGEVPMGAVLSYDSFSFVTFSPERFLRISRRHDGYWAVCEPIKGTAPRHENPELDAKSAKALISSAKDRAENIMIVDLIRNDLARACDDETVRVLKLCSLRSFRNVHHLVSIVEGRLRNGLHGVDMFECAFPSGSVTGAPKERAMEIICQQEQRPRGGYCGAIGHFDDGGGADFNVPIRTAMVQQQGKMVYATYGAGGGITNLSDPLAEHAEALLKAKNFQNLCGLNR